MYVWDAIGAAGEFMHYKREMSYCPKSGIPHAPRLLCLERYSKMSKLEHYPLRVLLFIILFIVLFGCKGVIDMQNQI